MGLRQEAIDLGNGSLPMIRRPGVKRISMVAWREAFAGVGVALALAVAAAGCSSGSGDSPVDAAANLYDAECKAGENQGDRCTEDCTNTCGFASLGKKYCTCAGGVYTMCACRPPDDWGGAPTAPYCDPLTGLPRYMELHFCSTLGQECLSAPPEAGGEQLGCRCVTGPTGQSWSCKPKGELEISDAAPSCEIVSGALMAYLDDKPCDTKFQQCIARDFFDGSSPRGCVCLGTASLAWNCTGTNRWFRAE